MAEHGSSPLPQGFVAATLPKLNRLLLSSTDGELLRPGTEAVKYMLAHDPQQLLDYQDVQNNKSGLEICLVIIDRLLQEGMDDHAAAQVGGLAAELVEKAGSERLGPYLLQLLRAVAVRLASAKQAAFIQSLILVFARLCLVSAKDVVDFLAQVQIGSDNALQVVMAKWLENSVNFAGYEEIRQKCVSPPHATSLNVALPNKLIQRDRPLKPLHPQRPSSRADHGSGRPDHPQVRSHHDAEQGKTKYVVLVPFSPLRTTG